MFNYIDIITDSNYNNKYKLTFGRLNTLTKKEKHLQQYIEYLQSVGFKQNTAGNWIGKGIYKNIIVYVAGNNLKIKYKGEIIFNQLISKTPAIKLETIIKPILGGE